MTPEPCAYGTRSLCLNRSNTMGTLAEYFAANRYVSQYEIGTRLFGRWNNIPFVGTVGNDSLVNELEGPMISIRLDLPIKYQDRIYRHIRVKHADVKLYR